MLTRCDGYIYTLSCSHPLLTYAKIHLLRTKLVQSVFASAVHADPSIVITMSKVDDAEMTSPRQQSDQQSVQIDEQEWVIVEPQDGAMVSECKNEVPSAR